MAEEQQTPPTSPPSTEGDKEGKTEEPKFVHKQFKSSDDLAKGYDELEKKLGQQGLELGDARKELVEAREYQLYTAPVVQLLDKDEALRGTVFEKLGIPQEASKPAPTVSTPTDSAKIKETVRREIEPYRQLQERQIFEQFEQRYGLDKLEAEKRKEQRARIGAYLGKWVPGGIQTIPLHVLSDFLEDAYFLANKDLVREQGKLEGRVEERGVAAATVGSMPSGEAKPSEMTLTPTQKRVAQMAKISDKDYAEALAKIESEVVKT